jgi:hypothetical protein
MTPSWSPPLSPRASPSALDEATCASLGGAADLFVHPASPATASPTAQPLRQNRSIRLSLPGHVSFALRSTGTLRRACFVFDLYTRWQRGDMPKVSGDRQRRVDVFP